MLFRSQDFLRSSPIGYALTHPEEISGKSVLQIWQNAVVDVSGTSVIIKFTYDEKEYSITPSVVVKALQLPEVSSYDLSYPDDLIREFIGSLGYNGDRSKLGKLVRAKLRKEWNFFFDCIGKCFTNKCSNYDALTQTTQQIGYSIVHNLNFDIASKLLEYIGIRITENTKTVYFNRFLHLM